MVVPPRLVGRWRFRPGFYLGLLTLVGVAVFAVLWSSRRAAPVARFRTAPIERRTVLRSVEASGRLDVARRFEVAAPFTGRLVEVKVASGARVRRGDILARLDARAASFDVRTARAEERAAAGRLADAEARHATAVETRQRLQRLVDLDPAQKWRLIAAQSTEDSARGIRDAVRAERDAIAQKRAAAELSHNELTLRAPVDGLVLSAPTSLGMLVGPDHGTLFTIADTIDTLELEASVAEADIAAVRVGQKCEFSVPAFRERRFPARVERLLMDPEHKQTAVYYPVLLAVDNPSHELLPGMTASVSIAVAEARDVLAVREAALRFTPDNVAAAAPRSRLWRSSDAIHFAEVPVAAGVTDGAYTEVRAAPGTSLAPGDPVIVGNLPRENDESSGPGIWLGKRQ